MLLLLTACGGDERPLGQDRADLLAALEADSPQEAAALCRQIRDEGVRTDCAWAVVPRLEGDEAAALCVTLPDGAAGHECWFLLGEAGHPAACANAGPMADDCRMHVFSRRIWDHFGPDVRPGQAEDDVLLHLVGVGFAPDDPRPWSAWFRQLFTRGPLDPAACEAVADLDRREVCARTALPVFHDRLNRGRDTDEPLCEQDPPWAVLDEALQKVLEERRAEDLCDPSKKQVLPG